MLVVLIAVGLTLLHLISKHFRRRTIKYLPRPQSHSWLVGNWPDIQRAEEAGEADLKWKEAYGLAFRTKGCFGEDLLHLIDPKAIQHVLLSGHDYPKTDEHRVLQQLTIGRGVSWAQDEQHTRQRKIMNPGFSYSALKTFIPLFFETVHKTTSKLKTGLDDLGQQSAVIDVSSLLMQTTMEIIGLAAFGYNFDIIEGKETELYKAYHNLFTDSSYMISDWTIMFRRLTAFAPLWLVSYILLLPKQDFRRLRRCELLINDIGRQLLAQQRRLHEQDQQGGSDIISLLVKANLSEDPENQLSTDEVLAQIMTLFLAGHETSANTLSWVLYELARHPDVQRKLREEIRATREKANLQKGKEISIADLESMKYMVAVIKETLRLHPILHHIPRRARHEDVIPLYEPQRTRTNEMITEIPVSKGQIVTLSLFGYNRLESMWGKDADQWRPGRFLEESHNGNNHRINLGTFGNLATFSGGLHNCIGWRFAMIEMQAILTELIGAFEFGPTPQNGEIKRTMAILMQPMVKGQEDQGTQLPLTITAVNEI